MAGAAFSEARCFALNKPKNLDVTLAPKRIPSSNIKQLKRSRHCFAAWVQELNEYTRQRFIAVGRLDRKTQGLIICTNNGKLSHQLCVPGSVDKEYEAIVKGKVTKDIIYQLKEGVKLKDGFVAAKRAKVLDVKQRAIETTNATRFEATGKQISYRTKLSVVIDVGKNRIVRRLLAQVGHPVETLKRIGIGKLSLYDLSIAEGEHVELTSSQIQLMFDRDE